MGRVWSVVRQPPGVGEHLSLLPESGDGALKHLEGGSSTECGMEMLGPSRTGLLSKQCSAGLLLREESVKTYMQKGAKMSLLPSFQCCRGG